MDLKLRPMPAIAVFIFVLALAAVLLVPAWHAFPVVAFSSTSVFLEDYPVVAYGNEELCTKINFHIPENILAEEVSLRVFSGQTPLFFESFGVPGKDFSKKVCFETGNLAVGDNKVEVFSFGKTLFFHLEKKQEPRPFQRQALIENISLSDGILEFTVKDFDTSFMKPVELKVNGVLDHRVYPGKQVQSFSERISMEPGLNEVSISFGGKTITKSFEKPGFASIPFPFGLALLVFSFFVFGCIFQKQGFVERVSLSMAIAFILLIALVFFFNYIGVLNFYSVTGIFSFIVLAVAFLFRKNLVREFSKAKKLNLTPLIAIVLCLFFVVPVLFNVFSFTDITYWNKFYERQSALIIEGNSIPVWDNLAYLGRTYSFAPGYFLLESGVGWVSGLRDNALFSAMLFIANAFLFFSLFYLGKSLKLSNRKIALFALFTAMSGFLLSAMSYSPRHVFSFAFFILALGFIIKHDRPAVTGLLLAAMAFIQLPLLVFFPLFYAIVARKIHLKRLGKAMAFALVITFLLLLPNLLLYGLPFQASPEEWGYLINYNLYYWFIDIVAILVFFVFFSFYDIATGKEGRDFYSKKLLFGFILGTAIQLFVIYRWNILTTTTLALLIAVVFPDKGLKDSITERILAILAIVTFGFLLFGMSYLNVHEIVTTPVSFVAQNTSTDSRVLADPMFGHDITSVAGRQALADLRVEYADQEKLLDAYSFLETKDYGILEKYGITHTFNQVDYIHRQAIGGKPKYGIIEFDQLDKVYSNGFIFVHRVREKN